MTFLAVKLKLPKPPYPPCAAPRRAAGVSSYRKPRCTVLSLAGGVGWDWKAGRRDSGRLGLGLRLSAQCELRSSKSPANAMEVVRVTLINMNFGVGAAPAETPKESFVGLDLD